MTWIRQWSNEWGERWEGAYGKDSSPHPAREDAPHIQMLDDAMRELYEEYPKEITAVRLMSLVSYQEAMQMLGVKKSAVYRWREEGEKLLVKKIKENQKRA